MVFDPEIAGSGGDWPGSVAIDFASFPIFFFQSAGEWVGLLAAEKL